MRPKKRTGAQEPGFKVAVNREYEELEHISAILPRLTEMAD